MNKEEKYNKLYMDIAERCSEMSYARRLHVGCVVVKDDKIISHSWNGMPKNFDNNCEDELEDGSLVTKKECLHSEFNAIRKIASSHESAKDSVMYCTHACCLPCALLIAGVGITDFYYKNDYRDTSGLDFLRKSGVYVHKCEEC